MQLERESVDRTRGQQHENVAQLAFAVLECKPHALYGVGLLICTGTLMAKFLTAEQRERIGELLVREAQKLLTPLH
jgi:hypothetical protein